MAPTTTSSRSSSRVPVSDSGQATPILEVSRLVSFYMAILFWRHGQRSVLDDERHRAIRSSGVNSTFRDIQALGQMQVALARRTPPQVAAYLEIQAVASDLEVRRCFEQDTSYILLFRHFVGLFLGLRWIGVSAQFTRYLSLQHDPSLKDFFCLTNYVIVIFRHIACLRPWILVHACRLHTRGRC